MENAVLRWYWFGKGRNEKKISGPLVHGALSLYATISWSHIILHFRHLVRLLDKSFLSCSLDAFLQSLQGADGSVDLQFESILRLVVAQKGVDEASKCVVS